jgi:hypothetical protein
VRNQPRTRSGTDIDPALGTAAHATEQELRNAYAAAVSHGARNTRCAADEERAYGTLRLLTLATLRLPDLFLYAHVTQAFCEDPDVDRVPMVVVDAVRVIAAGALRLAHRALETHARETGCEPGVWVDRALKRAGAWLARPLEADVPALLDHARRAAIALTRATSATADDPTLVPGEIADGLAHLLAVYLIATTLACRSRRRTPGAGTGPRARTWNYTLNITSADPPIGSSLVSCDLASHRPTGKRLSACASPSDRAVSSHPGGRRSAALRIATVGVK